MAQTPNHQEPTGTNMEDKGRAKVTINTGIIPRRLNLMEHISSHSKEDGAGGSRALSATEG
jgi:hypothetical protein